MIHEKLSSHYITHYFFFSIIIGNEIMLTENIISLDAKRLKAQIHFEVNNRQPILRPCDRDLYPQVKIECFQDLTNYQCGDTIEVDVVELQSSNGQSYFYSY